MLMHKPETLEPLARNRHLNIIHYRDCIFERSRIVGIVLDRRTATFQERLAADVNNSSTDDIGMSNQDLCVKKIEPAVRHPHTSGLAQNDLNPPNAMLKHGELASLTLVHADLLGMSHSQQALLDR